MGNPLDSYAQQEGFRELQEIVRTIVVNYDNRYFRIEVLRNHRSGKGAYSTWIWEKKENSWVHFPLVSGGTDDPDTALAQALACLSGETLS